jgi:hypothetical protein
MKLVAGKRITTAKNQNSKPVQGIQNCDSIGLRQAPFDLSQAHGAISAYAVCASACILLTANLIFC